MKQRFRHTDYDVVEKARLYVREVGPNKIRQDDPELVTLAFVDSALIEVPLARASKRRKAERTFAVIATALTEERERRGRLSARTALMYERYIREDYADWADRDIASITTADIERKRVEFRTKPFTHNGKDHVGYAPKVVATRVGFALGVLHWAAAKGFIKADPTDEFDHKRNPPRQRGDRFITRAVWDQVKALAPSAALPLVELLAGAGLRISEALALQVSEVRLGSSPSVNVQWQWGSGKVKTRERVKPKNLSCGWVSITPELAALLAPLVRGRGGDEFVFVTPLARRPWWYANFHKTYWQPMVDAARAAGVLGEHEVLTPHDLRHSHGSWLLNAGVPMHVVSKRLRHKSIQVTVDVYGHAAPDADDHVMAVLAG